jgi:hypothetical protein
MRRQITPSPESAFYAIAAGHTVWGIVAYREQIRGLVQDLPGSVGDGIFDKSNSDNARAAGFWFLFVGPMIAALGRLYGAAEAAGDREAMRSAGRAVTAVSVAGWTAMPASGFPGGIALGVWLLRRARDVR